MAFVSIAATFLIYLSIGIYSVYDLFEKENALIWTLFGLTQVCLPTGVVLLAAANGIRFAESFDGFKALMDRLHKYCTDSVAYKESIKSFLVILLLATSITVFHVLVFFKYLFTAVNEFSSSFIFLGCLDVFQQWVGHSRQWQFTIEFYIFNAYVRVILEFLTHLKNHILNISKSVDGLEGDVDAITCQRFQEDLGKISSAYNCIAVCSDKLKQYYGTQILLTLAILTLYIVGLSSVWIYKIKINASSILDDGVLSVVLFAHLTMSIVVLLHDGQRINNVANDLKWTMALLHFKLLQIPGPNVSKLRKSVKAVMRQMAVQPVAIRLLGPAPLQLSALLLVLSEAVSYTIITLQFIHVL